MSSNQTLVPQYLSLKKIQPTLWVDTVLVVSASWFLALTAQISIPLPFTPVPITGQTLGLLMIGASLGANRGFMAVAFYLIQGCLGLPFFADGKAGVNTLLGASGGYLLGFLVAAYVSGLMAERKKDRRIIDAIPAFIVAQVLVYAIGMPWLGFFVGFDNIWTQGFIPFIPGLLIKSTLAGIMLPMAWRGVDRLR